MAVVKSVQNVSITIASGATTGTATISSVNTSYSALNFGGVTTSANANPAYLLSGVDFVDGTTVQATRSTSSTNVLTVKVTVWEFYPSAVKSLNTGSITITSGTSGTSTIPAVTVGNCLPFFGGCTTTDTSDNFVPYGSLTLTNTTTVTANSGGTGSGYNCVVYYTIVELNSGLLNSSVQSGVVTITTAETSATATISSVTPSQSMLLYNGFSYAGSLGSMQYFPNLVLTNGTTVTASEYTTATSKTVSMFVPFSVVEFKATDIKSLNRGTIAIGSGAASNTATISSVDTTLTASNFLGMTYNGSTTSTAIGFGNLTLSDATTLTATRGATDTYTLVVSYEAIEFKKASNGGLLLCF